MSASGKNRRRGKDTERALAQRLGGKRVGILQGEDIEHPTFSIECKEREKLPVFLTKAYQQAVNNCPEWKIPIVVLHQLSNKHDDDLVIIKLREFEALSPWKPILKS